MTMVVVVVVMVMVMVVVIMVVVVLVLVVLGDREFVGISPTVAGRRFRHLGILGWPEQPLRFASGWPIWPCYCKIPPP